MNWIIAGQGGENWDRSLEGFVPGEAKVVDKFKEVKAIFERRAKYLRGENQPSESRYIQSFLREKEFENVSNRLALLLAQAAATSSSSEQQQQQPLFWHGPVIQSLFGNYPRPVGRVVYSYGGGGETGTSGGAGVYDYYYSNSSSSQATSIAPGQEMAVSLVWN